jgi:MerR family transcriptional regulator/heat shock protein HspR
MQINKEEPVFTISIAAKLLGISIPTLRMYENEGLIIPSKSKSNQRKYSQADLERIQCIRDGISKKKISINGIKNIYSLIPCWEIVNCSMKNRLNCEAYNGAGLPCWTYNHSKNTCENRNCRECEVYKEYSECGKIKNLLKNIVGKS